MEEKWYLENTGNINQMLRVREDKNLSQITEHFPHLLVLKHQYHVSDDIMFPDPSCLAFFTAFEENHLQNLEDTNSLVLYAVDIFEGNFRFYIYSKNPQQTVYDCISFLKSNDLYKCEFEIVMNDKGERLNSLI